MIADAHEAGEGEVRLEQVIERTGFTSIECQQGLRRVVEASPPYIVAHFAALGFSPDNAVMGIRLLERGLRATELWPSEDASDALLAVIEARLAAADTPEERTALQRARDAIKGLAGETLKQVAIAYAKQIAGA